MHWQMHVTSLDADGCCQACYESKQESLIIERDEFMQPYKLWPAKIGAELSPICDCNDNVTQLTVLRQPTTKSSS